MRRRALFGPPIVFGLLWAVAVWLPSQSAIAAANDRAAAAQDDQLALVADIDRLNQAAPRLSLLDVDLRLATELVPRDPAVDDFLAALAFEADRAGVLLTLVVPARLASVDPGLPVGVDAVSVLVKADGGFEPMMDFIGSLDGLSRLVVVDRVTMSSAEDTTSSVSTEVSLRIFSNATAALAASPEEVPE